MNYRILALDLDGTLTNEQKQITSRVKTAVWRAVEQAGVTVVLASGRPLMGLWKPARELELERLGGYMLSCNGAQIVRCKDGRTVFERKLPREVLPYVCALADEYGLIGYTYDAQGIISEKSSNVYVQVEAFNNAIPVRVVKSLTEAVTWDVNKCIMVGKPAQLKLAQARLRERFGAAVTPVFSYDFMLEIMPAGVEKGLSLAWLTGELGYTREQVIACGDSLNDLPMIEYAGLGVAMANAYDAVKDLADYVAPSNEQDGVAHVVDQFIFGA